jgi:hypothetical protein
MANYFANRLKTRDRGEHAWLESPGALQPDLKRAPWSIAEAFLAILFSAAASDGDFSELEQEEFPALAHRLRALQQLDAVVVSAILSAVLARLAAGGEAALAEACRALPAHMRPSAFAHALDLLSCDGEILPDEAEFLDALVLALELNAATVQQIADVVLLKNRY